MILKPLFESSLSLIFLALYYTYTELFIYGTNFGKTKLIFPNMFTIHIKKSFRINNIIQTLQNNSYGPILSVVGLYSKKCVLFLLFIYKNNIPSTGVNQNLRGKSEHEFFFLFRVYKLV